MSTPRLIRLAFLSVLLAGGCSSEKPTQIVLAIATDLMVPAELDSLLVEPSYRGASKPTLSWDLAAGLVKLPATLTLAAGSDISEPARITVTGQKSGAPVVRRTVLVKWLPKRILLLRVVLTRSCLNKACSEAETCLEGSCGDPSVDANSLPDYSPELAFRGVDAGRDAAVDGSRREASTVDGARLDGPRSDGAKKDGPKVDASKVDGAKKDAPKVDLPAKKDGAPKIDTGAGVPGIFIPIPKGTFMMGSPPTENCRSTNEPYHQVTLTHSFELQSSEVTQADFKAVMGYNPSTVTSCPQGSAGSPDICPVDSVSWSDAAAYCNELSKRKGLAQCYSCTSGGGGPTCTQASAYAQGAIYTCPGYRLPTEAEWEFAYRAGTTSAFYNNTEPSTTCMECTKLDININTFAWYCGNAGGSPHPVQQKGANDWSFTDMAGNLAEWCNDWFTTLGATPETDPWGAQVGPYRVTRGGHYNSDQQMLRAASRYAWDPLQRSPWNGFRPARTK